MVLEWIWDLLCKIECTVQHVELDIQICLTEIFTSTEVNGLRVHIRIIKNKAQKPNLQGKGGFKPLLPCDIIRRKEK